ncbi:hypothetical protein FQR65_LT19099 [Abscondita terminalis]|nr:hypothetical protein FQR65_LT19099 [Abscondita terminalis]
MLVSMTNIYCYVEKNLKVTDRKTRPLEEGERLYLAGVVGNCGLENNVVKARCLTSKVSAEPHRIEITFGNYEGDKIIITSSGNVLCTCKAGAGEKCKHIVATLLYIYNASDLGPLSCTETEQAWGKRKQKEIVEVIPVDEFCHVPSRSTSAKPLPVVDEFFSLCLQAVPDSEAAVHLSKLRNPNVIMKLSGCITLNLNEVLEAICHHAKTNNKYWKMLYELDIPSTMSMCCVNTYNEIYPCNALDVCRETLKKEKWCDERKFRITGSRCYSLYTYSKNNWAEKASKYFFDKPFAGNFATNYGVIQEKVARNIYMAHLLEDENIVEVGLSLFANLTLG